MHRKVLGGIWRKKGTKICKCGCVTRASAQAAAAACLYVCVARAACQRFSHTESSGDT